jgi:hypothetical protein
VAVVATLSKGYDLDYIWKQVDRGPAKDAAGYYIQASEGGGEPPGRWWGPGAKALSLEPGQMVEREPYDLLFGQRKAPDGTPLGRPPGHARKAADLYARLLAAVRSSRRLRDIGSGCLASGQPVGRRDEDGAPAATDVEHVLVASQIEFIEQLLPDRQLGGRGETSTTATVLVQSTMREAGLAASRCSRWRGQDAIDKGRIAVLYDLGESPIPDPEDKAVGVAVRLTGLGRAEPPALDDHPVFVGQHEVTFLANGAGEL